MPKFLLKTGQKAGQKTSIITRFTVGGDKGDKSDPLDAALGPGSSGTVLRVDFLPANRPVLPGSDSVKNDQIRLPGDGVLSSNIQE